MTSIAIELAFGGRRSSEGGEAEGRWAARRGADGVVPVVREPDDGVLVARTREGDREAFETLVCRYHTRLIGAAEAALGGRAEAEDVVQDVLLGVWVNRAAWEPSAGAAVYLFGAVANRVRNVWRGRARTQRSLDRAVTSEDDAMDSAEAVADDIAEVWEAVARLPERWQTAIVLRYVRDVGFAEVGAAMGISENAAKKLVRRAVAALTKMLTKK